MKSTGIIRRIDGLGRIVIPKEIRHSLGISEDSPIEICIDKEKKGIYLIPYNISVTNSLEEIITALNEKYNTNSEVMGLTAILRYVLNTLDNIEHKEKGK